jgi:TRAP-type C4-dicarboxylate transport system substrate-binding protein
MKFAIHVAPSHYLITKGVLDQWVGKVEERTNGAVKITIYHSETLGKQKDEWDMLKSGISDIGWLLTHIYPGAFPLSEVFSLPFMSPSGKRTLPVVNETFDKFLNEEFGDLKVLWPGILGATHLHTVKKPVRTLEDLKGMQIRAAGKVQVGYVKALGATPSVIAPPELYTALERGTVDGTTFPMEAVKGFRLYEVVKYHTLARIGLGICVTAMNLETWNSLPPDIQEIFEELSPWAQQLMTDAADAYDEEGIAICKEVGNEIIYLAPEERARWVEASKSVIADWAAGKDAEGLPGTAIVNEVRRLAAE